MEKTSNNWSIIRAGLLQFIFFIALGAGLPFFSLFFKKVLVYENGDVAHHLIGILFFLQAVLGIFGTPAAGILTDKFKTGNRIMTVCAFVIFISGLLLFLPGIEIFSHVSLKVKFLIMLIAMIINGLFYAPIVPLIDNESLNVMYERYGSGERYGNVRVFGTLGWLIAALCIGWLLHVSSALYIPIVGYALGFFVLALIALTGVKPVVEKVKIPWERLKNDSMYKHFLVFIFFMSFSFTSSFTFTGFFLDDRNVSYLFMGLAFGLSVIPEIPLMFNTQFFIRRLGNRWMIIIGVLFQFFKLVGFVLLATFPHKNVAFIFILVQSLHGFGFPLFYAGQVNLADRQAHKDLRATYQNLMHLVWTFATAIGGIAGSFIIKYLGSTWLMGIDSLIMFAGVLYFLLFVRGHGPVKNENLVIAKDLAEDAG